MRQSDAHSFYEHWEEWLDCKKDSRITLLLEDSGDVLESVSNDFRIAFSLKYQVAVVHGNIDREDMIEELGKWKPAYLAAMGNYHFLQKVCHLRQTLCEDVDSSFGEDDLPLILFLTRDCRSLLAKRLLWIRDGDGEVSCLECFDWQQRDIVVLPDRRLSVNYRRFGRALDEWEEALYQILLGQNGSLTAEVQICGQSRFVWEELAEPLWLRYGIPIDIGLYHAFLFLYRISGEEFQRQLDAVLCEESCWHADWHLEKTAQELYRGAAEAVWVPRGDVEILTGMAMAGIEMLPEQILSRQQVGDFYYSLCRPFHAE